MSNQAQLERDKTSVVSDRVAMDKPTSEYHRVEVSDGQYGELCIEGRLDGTNIYDEQKADLDGKRLCPRCQFEAQQRGVMSP